MASYDGATATGKTKSLLYLAEYKKSAVSSNMWVRQRMSYTSTSMATDPTSRLGRWRIQWLPTLTFLNIPWKISQS